MRIFIYIFSLLLCLPIFSFEKPIIISLGDRCIVSLNLRQYGHRTEAYPFDWVVVPFDGLYRLLNEDFSNFFLKENLTKGPNESIIDIHTGCIYYHDFPVQEHNFDPQIDLPTKGKLVENFLDYYEPIYEKYLKKN